jgi:hypothetical protein
MAIVNRTRASRLFSTTAPAGRVFHIQTTPGTRAGNTTSALRTAGRPEGKCGCPMVGSRRTPAFWCNGFVGYQKEAFETIFGRPVRASLKESKLSGSKRCVFEVTLA